MLFKILFTILSLVGVGLPFDTIWHYLYILIIACILVYGINRKTLFIKHLVIGGFLLIAAHYIPKIEIIEQSRLLCENSKIISPQEFIKNINNYPFYQTADGYVQGLGLSRKARDVSLFNRPWCLRSGYINRAEYNFGGPPPALSRLCLPFVVCYKVNEDLVKHGLNGSGLFYFKDGFIAISEKKDISFEAKDIGTYFYVFGADLSQPESKDAPYLNLTLNKTFQDQIWLFCEIFLKTAAILLIAWGFFELPIKQIDTKEILLLLGWITFLWFMFYDYLWVGIFALGGTDGIVHGGAPYNMLEAAAKGDWYTAIQSTEPVFYYMPGMRYIRFFETLIFGDAYPLQVTLLIFTPVIYYRFFKELISENWALVFCLVMIIGVLNFMGLDFYMHVNSLAMLYGEGFAFACLMGALVILLQGIKKRTSGLICFGLFTISLSIRPNMLFFVSVLVLAYFFSTTFSNATKKNKFIDLCGLIPLLLIPLHNVYFGHKLVLLTTASQIPENMPLRPTMYLDAFKSLFGLIGPFEWKQNFIHHFSYPRNAGWIALFFIVSNIIIAVWKSEKSKTGILAIACILGLSMHMCYLADIRYMHPYFVVSACLLLSSICYVCNKTLTTVTACDSGAT